MMDIRNNWIQTIATESPGNPNLTRYWFGQLGTARGVDKVKIDAGGIREAWEGLAAELRASGHPLAFEVCQPCDGRGFTLISREDCPDCACKGWKPV